MLQKNTFGRFFFQISCTCSKVLFWKICQKEKNIHIKVGKSKEDFVKMRDERDKKLNMPKLIIPSLQVNMRAGNMPDPDDQGNTYVKVPVNKL